MTSACFLIKFKAQEEEGRRGTREGFFFFFLLLTSCSSSSRFIRGIQRQNGAVDNLTRAEYPFVASAGEVVALAEAAVNLPKLGLVAETLVTAALPSAAADLLPLSFSAGAQVHAAGLALLTLAVSSQVTRFTMTGATVVGP